MHFVGGAKISYNYRMRMRHCDRLLQLGVIYLLPLFQIMNIRLLFSLLESSTCLNRILDFVVQWNACVRYAVCENDDTAICLRVSAKEHLRALSWFLLTFHCTLLSV